MRLGLGWPLPEAVLVFWGVFATYVVWQSLTPRPDMPFSFEAADKLLHFLAYCGLALLPWAGFRDSGQARAASFCMLLLGALMELGQCGIPERSGSLLDMAANALGVFCGLWAGGRLRCHLYFPLAAIRP